ncbi:MAG: hypothetical protein ACR2J8_10880 [Thermomicrobiales bacterium]
MDELDEERSNGQIIAAASTAAGLLGALAVAMSKRKGQPKDGPMGISARSATTGPDYQQVIDQVAEVAPDLVAALDRHAPEVSRQIRSKLPLVRAFGGASLADAVEFGRKPKRVEANMGIRVNPEQADVRVAEGVPETVAAPTRGDVDVDFSALSAAQAAAAQAAIAAVSKAETAFGASERFASLAGKSAADSVAPLIRDVAQQAAVLAVDLWQNARNKSEAAVEDGLHAARLHARDLAKDADSARHDVMGIAHMAADDARREAEAARERAERAQREAEAALRELRASVERETGKIAASLPTAPEKKKKGGFGVKFMWIASLLGLGFYVFMDEERRKETGVQVREMLRDLRGYDDEF